jgi:Ca-activated chloride channel family protein
VSSLSGVHFTLLGYPLGFAFPWALGLLAVVAVVLGVGLASALGRRIRAERLLSTRLWSGLAPGVSVARPTVQASLYGAGLVLFAVALAQPQCGASTELVKRRGVDVVVALDASKSMLARDVQPSRLERAKLELTTLLDALKGDRVGIVVFAGDAFIQCPLTSDYTAAKMFLRAVDTQQMQEGGTNIGGALQEAMKVLDEAERGAKERVVVLLSDGEDLSGEVEDAVAGLKEKQVKVYTVGIGSESGEPIPLLDKRGEVVDYIKDKTGSTVLSRLDRAGLLAIAEETGGEFFYAPKAVAVPEVAAKIDKLKKSEFESHVSVRYDERFQTYAGAGLFLLTLGMLLRSSAKRVGA